MSQGIDRLRVMEAAKTAYGSIWLQRRRLAAWAPVPLLLVAVIELLFRPYVVGLDQIVAADPGARWLPSVVIAGQARDVLQMAAWTVLELACYRLFLLGPGSELPGSKTRAIYASLLAFNVLLMAVSAGPSMALRYAAITGGLPAMEAISFFFFLIYIFIGVRLLFVFPAICLGWPWDLRARWAETEGNFWRLLLALLLAYLPTFVLLVVFTTFRLDVSSYEFSAGASPMVEALARAAIGLVGVVIATAMTAAAVAQLTGFRAAGMTGQGPGPTQIASRFD